MESLPDGSVSLISAGRGILFDDRWIGPHGIGRYAAELYARIGGLVPVPHSLPKLHPLEPLWLSWVVARARPRAYLTPGFNPPLVGRVPLVLTVHDLNHLYVKDNSTAVRRAYYRAVVRPGCRRAAWVLTGSEFARQQILHWAQVPESRVVAAGYGVADIFTPQGDRYAPGYPYLFYVGARFPHKNLPRLLAAFGAARIDPAIRLLLTGAADAALLNVARQAGCAERVGFVGTPDDTQLARLYRGAVAHMMPSTFEGFGLPAVEAMACGVPTLVSRAAGLLEACADAGLAVEAERTEAIREGIERICGDAPLRSALIARGVQRAAQFTWERTASRIARLLDQLPRESGPSSAATTG